MIAQTMRDTFKMMGMGMGGIEIGGVIYVHDNSRRQFCSGGPSCA